MASNSKVFLGDTEIVADEASGSVAQRIVRTGSLDEALTITYGRTGNTAVDGQDFVGGIGTATMPAGAAEIAVPVALLDDAAAEGTEQFVFSLINVEGGGALFAPRTSRISILDDEAPTPPPDPEPPLSSDYAVSQVPVASGLEQPIKMAFSPIDPAVAFVAEKPGAIRIVDTRDGSSEVFLDIRDRVNEHQDRGIADVALHPDFANNPYVYAYVIVDPPETAGQTGNAGPDGAGNRYAQLLRFTADAATGYTTVVPGSEVVLLGAGGRSLADISGGGGEDFTNPYFANHVASDRYMGSGEPPASVVNGFKQDYIKVDAASHFGGSLEFGPDGMLYVSTGDGTSFDYADPHTVDVQELDGLAGKILRIDPLTGLGLADNPFAEDGAPLDANRAKVFQLGLRNPFSTGFDGEGRLFIANTGWDSWEMISMGGPGANFGWPYYEGGDGGELLKSQGYQDFESAKAFYESVASGGTTVAPAFRAFAHDSALPGYQLQAITGGAAIYTGDAYPADFKDDYFFADFSEGEVFTVDTNDSASLKFLYRGDPGTVPLDFVQGADGFVYYTNYIGGEIGRLEITEAGGPPPPPPSDGAASVGEGPDALVLRISQDAFEGDAQYTVSVDGAPIGGVLSARALRGSGQADELTVRGDWAPGPHTVDVTFLNDAWGGFPGAGDRNLYVEGAIYNGGAVDDAWRELFAPGPASIGFTDAGGASATTTLGSGPDSLVLRVSQDANAGSAQYTVSVDGVQIGGVQTAAAPRGGGGEPDTVNVLGDWVAGDHTVAVDFLNDAWDGTAENDRNLYVDGAAYNGAAVPGAARTLYAAGPAYFAFTETATPATAATTVGSGPDALVLRITQDAYAGSAQFTVSVDGAQVGGTLTAQALHGGGGEADTVTVLGDFAPGDHYASIDFLNDAWGGTAETDRNLHLEGATYNGAEVAGAAAVFASGGPQGFGFTEASPVG